MGKDGLLSMDAKPVVKGKDFVFAAMSLEHGHIYDMCKGLCTAGGCLKWVYDPDPEKLRAFTRRFPQVKIARDEDEILQDTEVRMVAAADVPAKRCALGLRVMDSGKDYFTDKAPMTTLEQLEQAREKVKETGRMYAVFYSERVGTESGVYAGQLIEAGAIGKVIQVIGMGPHRLGALPRPDWFYDRELAGESSVISGATRWNSSSFIQERRMRLSPAVKLEISDILSILAWRILGIVCCLATTEAQIIFGWIGLRRMVSAHGGTDGLSSWGRTGI